MKTINVNDDEKDEWRVNSSMSMGENEKRFYTIAEVLNRLNITQSRLARKLTLFNIEIKRLPGSSQEYIAARDVETLERSVNDPTFYL